MNNDLTMLDLFSGIGGFSYAAEKLVGGFRTVAFCEQDQFCQKILNKHWPEVPIIDDVKELAEYADELRGIVDIVCGGFPCQPVSVAGVQRGDADDRWLWPEKCLELYKVANRSGSLEKMLQVLLTSQGVFYSSKCKLIWRTKVTPYNRLYFQLRVKTHPIEEIEYGLLATPNTMDYLPQRSEESMKKMAEGHRKGRKRPSNLREQVSEKAMALWPTPDANMGARGTQPNWTKNRPSGHHAQYTLNQAVRDNPGLLPTPTTQEIEHPEAKLTETGRRLSKDGKSSHSLNLADSVQMLPNHKGVYQGGRIRNGKISMDTLDVAVQATSNQDKTGATLSPKFVEWMMGYPRNWTVLKDGK